MSVYDMVRATIDCPYCGKDSTIVEQINKGSYAMKIFYIGDKLSLEPYYGDDIWKYDLSCSECLKSYKVNFYINNVRFTKAVVFEWNNELRSLIHSKTKARHALSEEINDLQLKIKKNEKEVKKRFSFT